MLQQTFGLGYAVKENISDDIYTIVNKANDAMYQDKLTASRSARNKLVKNLLNTLGAKSYETEEHALRMTKISFLFGEFLGLSEQKINNLSLVSTLHDIGKVNISERILRKADKLNDEEWELIKSHPDKGSKIALSIDEFHSVAEYILHHHERWDGKGYPAGLKENEIPLLSRIITIIDSYDVMTNDRPYSKAMSQEAAINEIEKCSGTQFDPNLAAHFIDFLKKSEDII